MKALLFLPLALLLAAAPIQAQTPTPTPPPADDKSVIRIFRATLPGGVYQVAVNAIIAVTSHEYLVDGGARVTEVNIDTTGSLLVRFYYIEPNTPNAPMGIGSGTIDQTQRLLREAQDKTGQDVWKKVVKNYPTTTHARTVEYRVESKEQLNRIFSGADLAFRQQKDVRIEAK